MAHQSRLPHDIRAERGEKAPVASIIAMAAREVLANDVGQRRVRAAGQPLEPACAAEHARGDFGGQIVFRREVPVEAAVRQTGAFHDVGDTDAVVAPLAKERARDLQNLLAVRRRLLARHSRGAPLSEPA